MVAVLHIAHGRARVKVAVEIVRADALHKRIDIAVDRALAGDGEVVCILGIDKGIARLERDRAVHCLGARNRGIPGFDSVRAEIGRDIRMCFEQAALFQMQFYVGFQDDRAGVKYVPALKQDPAAARRMAGINRSLDGGGIVGCAVCLGTIVHNVEYHNFSSFYNKLIGSVCGKDGQNARPLRIWPEERCLYHARPGHSKAGKRLGFLSP